MIKHCLQISKRNFLFNLKFCSQTINLYQTINRVQQPIRTFLRHADECESQSVVSDSFQPHGLYSPWNSPGQNTGVSSLCLRQGNFPLQGSNPGLPHCRRILYQLSHQRSPRILEWMGSLSLFQGIFLTQESNRGLLHCRRILY